MKPQNFYDARAGVITASADFYTICAGTRQAVLRLRDEKRSQIARPSNATKAMRHGIKFEPEAAAELAKKMRAGRRNEVLMKLGGNPKSRIGATPDLLGRDQVGEVKCPTSFERWEELRAGLRRGKLPPKYWYQVQGQIWVCGAAAGFFGAYLETCGLAWKKFLPDETFQKECVPKIMAFAADL